MEIVDEVGFPVYFRGQTPKSGTVPRYLGRLVILFLTSFN